MLYGYFAVSGDQEQSAICCLCGFIAEADEWDSFDHAWTASIAEFSSHFDATACLCGTGIFQPWDAHRRHALLADLSRVLSRSSLVPMGASVVREHFSRLSSVDRAALASEGIQKPLDLTFYQLMERIIRQVHEESEKISLLLDGEPKSAANRYNELFNKYLNRYLLAPHLMGTLALGNARGCGRLQASKLLAETVLFVENQELSAEKASDPFPVPSFLQKTAEAIRELGTFDAAQLRDLTKRLKSP